MWIYWGLVAVFGILMILSAGTEMDPEVKWYQKPFCRGAEYLLIMRSRWKKKQNKKENKKEREKLETMLLCFALGLLLFPVAESVLSGEEQLTAIHRLERPEKGEGNSSYALQAEIQNQEDAEQVKLELQERQYTEQEELQLLKQAEEEIDQVILGENTSADEVRGRVELPSELQNGEVTVQWIQNPQGYLDGDGNIVADLPEKGQILTLTAMLSCGEREQVYERALHLFPQIRTEEEQLKYDLNQALTAAQEESREKKTMELPQKVDGRNVVWTQRQESMTGICLAGIFLLAAAGYFGKAQEHRKAEEQRQRQLILDYPDVVFKLGMLLNAGLTIQNAFVRIAGEYQEMKAQSGLRWAYEEMMAACNEMKSGIAEARAYERFGRRCEQTCYVRLGTILSGGLQKSSEGMTELLLNEAEEAMEDRRQLARKMGEEAGTRLLFPMILMLLVVLVILIVPAVLSF